MKLDPSRVWVSEAATDEPITVEEARLHLRIDHEDEDTAITEWIATARKHCEDVSRRAFVTRTLTGEMDVWPNDNVIELPYPPLIAVASITYTDEDGNALEFSASNYLVDVHREPGRIVLRRSASWPSVTLREVGAILIEWTAGYGEAADVPAEYKAAIKLVVGDLYENREAITAAQGLTVTTNPTVDRLLLTDRG